MAAKQSRSPFVRLRKHYEKTERRCTKCGFVDDDGKWRVTARGGEVHFQHICPRCDAIDTRVLRYDR
ncbi:HVO_0649 family zinc finger protein [Haladaptatus pallidirubidus]|uniref:Small CPxCG-related zinc finger protein n=1 Tax=Haladaptatus pallidirubidus TaxID=1008152 RepID=A0AAV3UEX6_9EURY|nr:HVO_0649 family zinc finger protein [Haladaptatus pallidirubidus]